MKVSSVSLHTTRRLDNKDLPLIDDDEWVEILSLRNAIGDLNAQIKASSNIDDLPMDQRPVQAADMAHGTKITSADEDPDVQAMENRAKGIVLSPIIVDEGLRWAYVADYMIVDFCLWDIDPDTKERSRKYNPKVRQDRDDVFALLGRDIISVIIDLGGGTPTPPVKGPDGKMATFQGSDTVGDTGPAQES